MAAEVKIYTRMACGYCGAAQRLLRDKGVVFESIDCTGNRATRQWLAEQTKRTTVPQIFIGGRHIGGCDELMALDRAGKLDPKLGIEA